MRGGSSTLTEDEDDVEAGKGVHGGSQGEAVLDEQVLGPVGGVPELLQQLVVRVQVRRGYRYHLQDAWGSVSTCALRDAPACLVVSIPAFHAFLVLQMTCSESLSRMGHAADYLSFGMDLLYQQICSP